MISNTRSWLLLFALQLACETPGSSEARITPRTVATAPAPEPAAAATCRDYSELRAEALPALPASQYVATLQAVWQRVLEKHYDPTLGCKNWPELRLEYAKRLVGIDDSTRAYELINAMLAELGQSHFRLFASHGADEHGGPAAPPVTVRWIEDQPVIVSSTATDRHGLIAPGAVVVAIDGVPLAPLLQDILARTTRPSEAALEVSRAVMAKLSCAHAGITKQVRLGELFPSPRQRLRTLTCVDPPGDRLSMGNLENLPARVDWRMLSGTNIGYLHFNIWMLPMVARVEAAIAELRRANMTDLVIDLRGNPGGVGAMAVPIARRFMTESGSLGTLKMRDFTQEFRFEAGLDPFVGKVVILVDEGTASTSEIFAAGLRDLGRATIVGARASAGAALPSVIEQLEGGAVLQYVVGDYRSPRGTRIEAAGLMPDVVVNETRAAFAHGHDPVLEAAVRELHPPIEP